MKNDLSKITQVVIVTYNPDIPLLKKNVLALNKQFEHILIIDNGSNNISEIKRIISELNHEIKIISYKNNQGIAYALNYALNIAIKKKLEWLLSMDQDTVIPDNFSDNYLGILEQEKNVALLGWTTAKKNTETFETFDIITSGCLINVEKANVIGGFNNDLFIYHVDTDVTLRMKEVGRTLVTNSVKVDHHDGEIGKHRSLSGKILKDHSMIARYYTTRNSIYLLKKNFLKHPIFSLRSFVYFPLQENTYFLFYSNNKYGDMKIMCKAFWDGWLNRLGKYDE